MMQKLPVGQRAYACSLGHATRLKGQLHLQQVANQVLMRESISDAYTRQAVDFRKRPQRNYVVVTVVHRIRVARIVFGVFKVRFIQDNQDAFGNVPVKIVELVLGKYGTGRIVGIGQVDDFGSLVDFASEPHQIVVPGPVRNRPVLDATRFGEHLKADEGSFGGKNFVLIAQKSANDVGHNPFRTAAGDDVFGLQIELDRKSV